MKRLIDILITPLRRLRDLLFPIRNKGANNKLAIRSKLSKRSKLLIIGNSNQVSIGKSCTIERTDIHIMGNNSQLSIGDGFCIRKGCISIEGDNCNITIGEKTTIRGAELIAKENGTQLMIGQDCLFSHSISIRTSDGHPIYDNDNNRINPAKKIMIGNHVWIAQNVCVLKGAHIYDNSIIGFGSIVTYAIPANCIAVGIPAKVVKENVYWKRTF